MTQGDNKRELDRNTRFGSISRIWWSIWSHWRRYLRVLQGKAKESRDGGKGSGSEARARPDQITNGSNLTRRLVGCYDCNAPSGTIPKRERDFPMGCRCQVSFPSCAYRVSVVGCLRGNHNCPARVVRKVPHKFRRHSDFVRPRELSGTDKVYCLFDSVFCDHCDHMVVRRTCAFTASVET